MIPSAAPLSFSFNFSDASADNSPPESIAFQGDAFFDHSIHLTKDGLVGPPTPASSGRAVFRRPVPLYHPRSRRLADFSTRFSFLVRSADPLHFGDGLAFFLSPFPSLLPNHSSGGFLGLFDAAAAAAADPAGQLVAVEFDTYENEWDPSADHVGVDVNSIRSAATLTWGSSMKDGRVANAWIAYDGAAQNLTVFLTYDDSPSFDGRPCSLSFAVDLRQHLPDRVAVGFSAATGGAVELHQILHWEFTSTLDPDNTLIDIEIAIAIAAGFAVLISILGLILFLLRRRRRNARNARRRKEAEEEEEEEDDSMAYDELAGEFEIGSGPRRFRYAELAAATDNFAEERKLGEGGFGAVYRGFLRSSKQEVAVKRVAKGSSQGRKEYVAEVRIISRLQHRNLVRLVGWCHDRDADFLLVYELVPNGSLDLHLYSTELFLPWQARYRVAVGLASAILYLHEECEQCVVHRDIKPSNVMLDSAFNAKLGDFGLARLIDHDDSIGAQTTVLAGTVGYLAPECVTTGKASKESDVYSFGIVALEIACGRRPVEPKEEPGRARLLPWAWEMHGRNAIQEAADDRLNKAFDEAELGRLVAVGLWCAHPDWTLRPSIRQAVAVLKFESPPPVLPPKMPVPVYFVPPIGYHGLSGAASSIADAGDSAFGTSSSSDRLLES